MNELVFLVVGLTILGGWAMFVVIAITIHDIRSINLEKALRRHPHARRWRRRPMITINYDAIPSATSTQSLQQGGYRNIRIEEDGQAELSLQMGADDILHRLALRDANSYLQYRPTARFVEIMPQLAFPQTTRQFFAAYRTLALAPFVKVHAVMNTNTLARHWPVLLREHTLPTWRERFYTLAAWMIAVTHLLLFLYIGYVSTVAGQVHYLLVYLAVFGLWLLWSITSYPRLSVRQRLAYMLLAPASLGYFLWRIFAAPFALLWLLRPRITRRRVLS